MPRALDVAQVAFGAAIAYLLLTGWAMQRTTYDVWGALVIGPQLVGLASDALADGDATAGIFF